jgi:lipid-A-disaccharide synthase
VVAELRGDGAAPLIALLPGSRRHVIRAVLPLQLEVLRRLRAQGVAARAAVSCVDEDRAALVRALLADMQPPAAAIVGDNASLLTAADLVLVASGTATLEVAHYRKTMIVMYDAGGLLRVLHSSPYLRRRIVTTPHLSLVNILANARVVPEFMPAVPEPGAVAVVARQLLTDPAWRRLMQSQLDDVVRPLEGSQASANVCRILGELLDARAARPAVPAQVSA